MDFIWCEDKCFPPRYHDKGLHKGLPVVAERAARDTRAANGLDPRGGSIYARAARHARGPVAVPTTPAHAPDVSSTHPASSDGRTDRNQPKGKK